MEKKQNERFRQYAQRWREVATQAQPPLLEKETTMLFINTLKALFINHILGSATKSFLDIIMSSEMIENAMKSGKIDAGESSKRSAPRKKESEINNVGVYNKGYSKPITVGPPKTITTSFQAPPRKDSRNGSRKVKNYYEFHDGEDHKIQECNEFGALVQGLMDNKELEFFEHVEEAEGEESPISAPEEGREVGFYTRSGKHYAETEPVEGKTPMAEQEGEKTVSYISKPARISVLALLLSLEVHREALMKVLNETYVTNDISMNKLDRLVNNISANNFIFFNDDEMPLGGMGSTKALHITTRYKGYTLPGVLINNGSALNVLPLSMLNRLPIDSSHMKTYQNIGRAFDGTKRKVMGRIEMPRLIGLNTYEVGFLVMDIKPSYNCLLGRPWIHTAGAVPSLLHQKLKLVAEGRLVTINAEEDIIASVTSDVPYVGTDDEALGCSFRSFEFVNATFIIEGNKIPAPKISKTTKMGLQLTVGKGALPGRGLGRCLQGKAKAPMLKDKRDCYGLGFKPNARQRRKEIEKKQERRRARLSGEEVKWEPIAFPHISKTFVSGGTIHLERKASRKEITEEMSPDINDMSDITTDSESPFEQDLCTKDSQDLEDGRDCSLSSDLLRMVEHDDKQILPHKESVEIVSLGEEKEVKIGAHIVAETKQDLIELLQEFKDVFAWSYRDMPRVANIAPVPKKDEKVWMCVDYRDLNKTSPKDNFSLPHIDTLVGNTTGYLLFSFMDGFSGYNQIKMHPKDMEKTTFVTLWGTFCIR
ncbi:Gag-pro-like protein [Gossypium australe]|uniref:Gag-pro-like protein n=1 Tax=Gossypium australe TaxID=47621 RepID=A0A5B6WZD7_9ROSI|nr:Gag-pro-like protein [Gossypium australe]